MPARRVLMIEPVGFRSNPETAADNPFQRPPGDESPQAIEIAAREEFARLREALESRGVEVVWRVAAANREAPDAVFPNNWFSTQAGGTLVLYPMMAPSRRLERRAEIVAALRESYPLIVDLTASEAEGRYLEGTGSLVIDERARIVFVVQGKYREKVAAKNESPGDIKGFAQMAVDLSGDGKAYASGCGSHPEHQAARTAKRSGRSTSLIAGSQRSLRSRARS